MNKSGSRLSDIAELTGYSKNTVSLALRDSPRISEAARLVIRQAADELQYRPNYFAKSLSLRRSNTIGLLLADISNPILTETSKSLETELATHGYGTLFATANSTHSEEVAAVEMFRARHVDGILVYPTRDHRNYQHLVELRSSGFPLVMLIPGENIGVDMVSVDEKRGAYLAVRHLIDLGHTHIGTIDGSDPSGNRHKFDGYLQALASACIPFDPALQVDPRGFTPKAGYWAMNQLMSVASRPTAVFVANDYIAIGVMKWCLKHGLSVPHDMAIIGFDNLEAGEYLGVSLSTVSYKTEDITRMAIDRLLRMIDSPAKLPEPRVTLFEPELIIRESTGGAREG